MYSAWIPISSLYIVLFGCIVRVSIAYQCLTIHDKVNDGHRMVSSVFQIIDGFPILSCVAECMAVTKCVSVNYRNKSKTCHLNAEDSYGNSSDLHANADFFQSDIGNWPRSLAGPCEHLICPDSNKCATNRRNTAYCIADANTGCDFPNDMANAVKSSTGLYHGAVTTYTCLPDFLFCGSSASQRCSVSGQWEGLNGTCGKSRWQNLTLPFSEPLPCEMTEEYKLVIEATPIGNVRIKTALRTDTTVNLQFDIRFNYLGSITTTVFASRVDNVWMNEQTNTFPFTAGVPYQAVITRQGGQYKVFVDGAFYGGLADRAPTSHPNRLIIDNDVEVHQASFVKIQ